MALSPIERLRAIKELNSAIEQSKQAKTPIARLKATKAAHGAMQRLGIATAASKPATAPAPAPAQEAPQVQALRKIAGGGFDSQGIGEVMRLIQTAINGLGGADKLDSAAQQAANDAIDHWAQLEAA